MTRSVLRKTLFLKATLDVFTCTLPFKATRADVAALGTKLDDHAHDDATVEQRVALIEQARAIEAKTVSKHGATAGLFAGGSVMIVWEVVKHLAGWK